MKKSLLFTSVIILLTVLASCSTLNHWRYSIFGGTYEMEIGLREIDNRMGEIFPLDTIYYNFNMQISEPRMLSLDTAGRVEIIAQMDVKKMETIGGSVIMQGKLKFEPKHNAFSLEKVELQEFRINGSVGDFTEKAVRIYSVLAFKKSPILNFHTEDYKITEYKYNENSITLTVE